MKGIARNVSGEMFGSLVGEVVTPILVGIILLAVLIYLLPAVIAFFRRHKSKLAIFLVNFLFGWTIVGWLWALIWAFSKPSNGKKGKRKKKKRSSGKRK